MLGDRFQQPPSKEKGGNFKSAKVQNNVQTARERTEKYAICLI